MSWKHWREYAAILAFGLAGMPVPAALAAEPAVAVMPSDPTTIQTCFRLASIRFMQEQIDAMLDARDGPVEEIDPEDHLAEPWEPGARAVFLGWEKALVLDRRARSLNEEQLAAETEAVSKTFRPMLLAEMRGDFYDEKERCRELLVVRGSGDQVTVEMTEALDPADFGVLALGPKGRLISDDDLRLCLGQAESARLVVGAAALGGEERFHRLRRERDPGTYDDAILAALAQAMAASSEDYDFRADGDHIDTKEEIDAKVKKAEARRAERRARRRSYN